MVQGIDPFDDASGQELLSWLNNNGGVGASVRKYTGAGTTIADATHTALGSIWVTSTPVGSGVLLSDGVPVGQSVLVYNQDGAHTLKVYPPNASQQFGNGVAGVPITLAAEGVAIVTRLSNTVWIDH